MTDKSKRDFDRMFERHREEIQRQLSELRKARAELDQRLLRATDEAREAAQRMIDRVNRHVEAAGKGVRAKRPPRRFRRRGLEGGEPVPVEPRAKPKPLMDGAEAPIE